MCSFRYLFVVAVLASLSLGCSNDGFFNATGRVVKGGQPYLPPEGQGLRIAFIPVPEPGMRRYDAYRAGYDPEEGTFRVLGKDGRGLPPGKYYVALEVPHKKAELLGGRLTGDNSGLVLEVTSGATDLVIDLDKTEFDKALEATAQKKITKKKQGRKARD